MEYSQKVRRSFLVRLFKGSNPFIPIFYLKFVFSIRKNLEQSINVLENSL